MSFDFSFDSIALIPAAVCVVAALIFCLYYCLPLWSLARRRRECNAEFEAETSSDPDRGDASPAPAAASIVVYSHDDLDGLEHLLPVLLDQDYEGVYEVIVVDEGDSAEVRDYVELLQLHHRRLYLTHTPDGARNLSRKKLALTLGIKAARGEVVVLTMATATVPGRNWLRAMMDPFNRDAATEICFGAAMPNIEQDNRLGKRRRAFDTVLDAATWLTAAMRNHPYRGTEYNLAYRRDLFFANKGFSGSLNIAHGDDDIFINEVATNDNCAVQLCDDSIVTFDADGYSFGYRGEAMRRVFTGHRTRSGARKRMAVGPLAAWLWLAGAAAVAWLDRFDLPAVILAAVSCIAMLLCNILSIRSACMALNSRRLLLTIPYFTLTRPLRRIYYTLRSRIDQRRYYTWGK